MKAAPQPDLFHHSPKFPVAVPKTYGIKYAGSKLKLLPHILGEIAQLEGQRVLDAFSGSSRVAQALAHRGYSVTANDLSPWSRVFGECFLLNESRSSDFADMVEHLNSLPGVDGWFTEHYGGSAATPFSRGTDGLKKPWQLHNTRRLDAIRPEIDRVARSSADHSALLTSLMLALDAVDNTVGHYAAYLDRWSPRSYNQLRMVVPDMIPKRQDQTHEVIQSDIFDVLPARSFDIAYLDPPYGSNNDKMPPSRVRYAAYYHVWSSVCLNDRPKVFGKALRREDSRDGGGSSVFEEFRRDANGNYIALNAIRRVLEEVSARYVVLSYSSGGRATAEQLTEALETVGRILNVVEVDYRRNVMAAMRWTHEWIREAEVPNREFIFVVEKS